MGVVFSRWSAGGIQGCPQDTPEAVQLNPVSSAPLPLLSHEHESKPAGRGEEDDINYANSKATPHRRLTCKVSVLGRVGKAVCWAPGKAAE